MEKQMYCEYKFFKAVTLAIIVFVVKSGVEEKCNVLLSSNRSLLSKVYLSIQITINLLVVGVTFIVILNNEDLVSGLSDLPSMAYIIEIDSFFGQYFMRYLNSHFPTVAKHHSFLHYKTSIRSMKASHYWSRIAGSIWALFGCVEVYVTQKVKCPDGNFSEWFEGKYALVNSTTNNNFQAFMSYL